MKSIISTVTLCAIAASAGLSAQTVTSTDELSNTATYTIDRRSSSNSGLLEGAGNAVNSGSKSSDGASLWSIHYSTAEKAYYLYNISAGKFVGAEGGKAILTDTPVDMVPIYADNIGAWMLDCGGALLGMSDADKGTALFLENYTAVTSRTTGLFYRITTSSAKTLTQAESDAIEAKIKAGRPAALAKYQEFVDKAKAMVAADGLKHYAGAYDVDALADALANSDKYTLMQFEEMYREALRSRLPRPGHYYVMRNVNRPTSFRGNALRFNSIGTMMSAEYTTPKFQNANASYPDGLNLICVETPGADPTAVQLRIAATGRYLVTDGSNNAAITIGEKAEASTFTMEPRGDFNRMFRFALPSSKGYVTISGGNQLVNYNVPEEANYFYFEEIKYIQVTPPSSGITTACLPCPVAMPDGVEALIPVEEYQGKVYLEKHEGTVPANVPFIIRSKNGNNTFLLEVVTGEKPAFENDNLLVGTNVYTPAPDVHFTLTATGGQIGFKRNGKAANFAPNTAWLLSESDTDLTTSFDPRPNVRITEIDADKTAADAVWYDLQGRRVASPAAGNIYIDSTTRRMYLIK